MKSEPKAFASLSSGLLARKGAARPAMRPQGFGQGGAGLEDLGWNDMGFEPPKPAVVPIRDNAHDAFGEELPEQPARHAHAGLTPLQSPVHDQQAEIADRFGVDNDDDEEDFDETAELYDPVDDVAPEADEDADVADDCGVVAALDQPVFEAAVDVNVDPVVPAPKRAPRQRAVPGSKGKAAFTLRLDPERHLKLRLACAVDGRSAQMIVTDALDRLLAAMPEVEVLAEKAKRKE